jgi:hypothetical protein
MDGILARVVLWSSAQVQLLSALFTGASLYLPSTFLTV